MFSEIKTYNTTTSCCNYMQSLVASVNPQQQKPETENSRYYLGKYEKEINHTTNTTTEYYYIGGPMGNIAVYIRENGGDAILYYTLTDHLGSIIAIADEDGDIIEEQRFDPWGQYRCPTTGTPEETPQLTMLFRGYTGHVQRNTVFESEANQKQIVEQIPMTKEIGKMLPEFGLINMNARLYDPLIARVLSPDNYVQDPNNAQNYNRYSYCYNNPLKYTDPDGNFVFSAFLAFVTTTYLADKLFNDNPASNPNHWGNNKNIVLGSNNKPIGPYGPYDSYGNIAGQDPFVPDAYLDYLFGCFS
jgi:RHS repeat-associated protein